MGQPPTDDRHRRYPAFWAPTPVLSREPGVLQVGCDQEPSLVLADVTAGLARLLTRLDGRHSRVELRAGCAQLGVPVAELDWALRVLDAAGMLREGPPPYAPTSERRIRLVGAGVLGQAVAMLLVRSGLGVLHLVDQEPPDPRLYPAAGALGTQAAALAAALDGATPHGSRPTRVSVANHWTKPDDVAPDLTVLACDQHECDRVVAEGLLRADQPHLVLRARAGGVVVGPLVLPGETACLRCTDLSRRDADAAWPLLLPQLMRIRTPVGPALVGWAAGVAAAQVLAFLGGHLPESCGSTLEVAPGDHITRRRSWSMHPACGCGWGATAQWSA